VWGFIFLEHPFFIFKSGKKKKKKRNAFLFHLFFLKKTPGAVLRAAVLRAVAGAAGAAGLRHMKYYLA
jgi:hypothetical protein